MNIFRIIGGLFTVVWLTFSMGYGGLMFGGMELMAATERDSDELKAAAGRLTVASGKAHANEVALKRCASGWGGEKSRMKCRCTNDVFRTNLSARQYRYWVATKSGGRSEDVRERVGMSRNGLKHMRKDTRRLRNKAKAMCKV